MEVPKAKGDGSSEFVPEKADVLWSARRRLNPAWISLFEKQIRRSTLPDIRVVPYVDFNL